MHSYLSSSGITFHHHGDFTGDVHIDEPDPGIPSIIVPMTDLLEFVALAVQQKKIAALEAASTKEILGFTP